MVLFGVDNILPKSNQTSLLGYNLPIDLTVMLPKCNTYRGNLINKINVQHQSILCIIQYKCENAKLCN